MKKTLPFKILTVLLFVTLSISIFMGASAASTKNAPKNIIFMIGDGMGPNQVNMAHDSIGKNLNMETMPYKGTSETSNVYGQVTDSAAGGTALACGIKTANSRIGMDSSNQPVPNIREFFADMGKKTGLVSTVSITDATPAAFGAHNVSRANQTQIAAEYIEREIDIIMGGGANNFSVDLKNTAKDKGYTIINKKSELQSFDGNSKLLALFTGGDFPYFVDRYPDRLPTLEEMTAKCIEILSKNQEGFFLMVEGGAIDHAGHSNMKEQNIGEVLEFDKAVKVAMDFAKQDGNTLVIVTADHETGGLRKNGSTYTFTSGGHTIERVPVFAMGKGADRFQGDMINTDISKKIKALFNDEGSDRPSSTSSSSKPSSGTPSLSNTSSGANESVQSGTSDISGVSDVSESSVGTSSSGESSDESDTSAASGNGDDKKGSNTDKRIPP